MKNISFLLLIIISLVSSSVFAAEKYGVGLIGYVPFGPSTQKEVDGSRNTFTFHPGVSFHVSMPAFWGQIFLPELGYVMHRGEGDNYSKTTKYILLDLGHQLTPKVLFRYGIGTFMTTIKGDGGLVELNNGSSTATFAQPAQSETSVNSTLNLGVELAIDSNITGRFETFLFSILDSESRKFSYALSVSYYF